MDFDVCMMEDGCCYCSCLSFSFPFLAFFLDFISICSMIWALTFYPRVSLLLTALLFLLFRSICRSMISLSPTATFLNKMGLGVFSELVSPPTDKGIDAFAICSFIFAEASGPPCGPMKDCSLTNSSCFSLNNLVRSLIISALTFRFLHSSWMTVYFSRKMP